MRIFPEGNFGRFPAKLKQQGKRRKREARKEIKIKERCERGKGKFDEEFVDN
jgi:hypothetical protein